MLRLATVFVLMLMTAAAAAPPQASATSLPISCDKDKCTCQGSPTECFAALTSQKKCKDATTSCTAPPEQTPAALNNIWQCQCQTAAGSKSK